MPVFSEIFERCIASRLNRFLEESSVFSHNQYGFRRGCSTVDAIVSYSERVESMSLGVYRLL